MSMEVAEAGVTAKSGGPFVDSELVVRVFLVAAAVGLCYLFRWNWLRSLTASMNQTASAWLGVSSVRISPELVRFPGRVLRYDIACTMADAWCGAIPLVWSLRKTTVPNLVFLAGLAVFMLVLNSVRLAISNMIIFRFGVPWAIGHQGMSALAYLVVWLGIEHRGAWRGMTANEGRHEALVLGSCARRN